LVVSRANQKLSFKYFGPFQILERVGVVAYRLKLSDNATIHPVVHISQLKLAVGFKGTTNGQLPSKLLQFCIPLQVLGSRMVPRGSSQVSQVLIRRSELPNELVTWEDAEPLKQKFPLAWGQATLQEGRNVSGADATCPRRSKRVRQRNIRVFGPEWA
jgi:hypothetical protein